MGREEFIRQELARLLRDWCVKAFLFGAAVFLLLSPLDYVSVPSLFPRFLLYRLLMAVVLGVLALAAARVAAPLSLRLLAFLAIFFSAGTIEIMILHFHGHHSPYYAGMILLAVVALGFFPAGIRFHLFLAATIYLVYLLPLLALGDIRDTRTFFTQNYFLILILGAGIVIRHFSLTHLREKIGLHYDMLQQAENLEQAVSHRTEELVRASDEWRVTFDSTQDMMMLVEKDGTIVKANKAMAAFAGADVKELVGGSCYDVCTGNTIPENRHPLKLMVASGRREAGEFYSSRRDRWFLVSAEPLRSGHSREDGAVFIMRDISGIKILEQGLLEAKEEWEETFNIIEEGISIHDEDLNVLQANAATRRLLDLGSEPLEGRKCHELFHGTGGPISGCPGAEARRTGKAAIVNFFEPRLNRYFEVTALPRPGREGREPGIIHVIRDITERKEAIDAINRSYRRMERILEMAPFGVFIVGRDGTIEYANPAIRAISGMGERPFTGNRIGELPGCRDIGLGDRITEAFGGSPFRLGPLEFGCQGGEHMSVGQFTGIPVAEGGREKVIVFVDDLTELKQAEAERSKLQEMLLETQKMESIGTLAGGIAHDFNNILTAIMNYAGLVLMKLSEDDPVRPHVATILESGEKAAGLTRQLLDFSRRRPLERRALDLNTIVENLVRMLRKVVGDNVSLELSLHRPLKNIFADKGKIEQVLLNLAVNASDAMPKGGTLVIATEPVIVGSEASLGSTRLSPGHYVRLSVKDEGEGMTPEVQRRIFEPFFTTKKAGEGTGLGLATVYGIVKQHNGAAEVRSVEGEGSEFIVYLPVTFEEEAMERPRGQASFPRGSETVLVVDDDDETLSSTTEVLASLGYAVLSAPGGRAALELADRNSKQVDLLLTDLVMEEMDGKELAAVFTCHSPGTRLLFMSGYSSEKLESRGLVDLPAPVISKPVNIEALSMAVRAALSG